MLPSFVCLLTPTLPACCRMGRGSFRSVVGADADQQGALLPMDKTLHPVQGHLSWLAWPLRKERSWLIRESLSRITFGSGAQTVVWRRAELQAKRDPGRSSPLSRLWVCASPKRGLRQCHARERGLELIQESGVMTLPESIILNLRILVHQTVMTGLLVKIRWANPFGPTDSDKNIPWISSGSCLTHHSLLGTLIAHCWASHMVLVVKNLPANAGGIRDVSSVPGSGRSPGGGHGNPLQYSCLESPLDRGAWRAAVRGVDSARMHTVSVPLTTPSADTFIVCICWTVVSVRIMLVAMMNKTLKFESLSPIDVYLSLTWSMSTFMKKFRDWGSFYLVTLLSSRSLESYTSGQKTWDVCMENAHLLLNCLGL